MTVFLMALAGGVGAVTRFLLDGLISSMGRRWRYPVGTTLINLTGSFLLGLIAGLVSGRVLGDSAQLVLGTGFLGGYTTFSTAAYEVVRSIDRRRWGTAALHAFGLVVAGTALAALGYVVGAS